MIINESSQQAEDPEKAIKERPIIKKFNLYIFIWKCQTTNETFDGKQSHLKTRRQKSLNEQQTGGQTDGRQPTNQTLGTGNKEQ